MRVQLALIQESYMLKATTVTMYDVIRQVQQFAGMKHCLIDGIILSLRLLDQPKCLG